MKNNTFLIVLLIVMIIHYVVGIIYFGGTSLATIFVLLHLPGVKPAMIISFLFEIIILIAIYKKSRVASLLYGGLKGILGLWTGIIIIATAYKFNLSQTIVIILFTVSSVGLFYFFIINTQFKLFLQKER